MASSIFSHGYVFFLTPHSVTINNVVGDLLVSTGDDASIRTWKKAVNGRWTEYAEIEPAGGA